MNIIHTAEDARKYQAELKHNDYVEKVSDAIYKAIKLDKESTNAELYVYPPDNGIQLVNYLRENGYTIYRNERSSSYTYIAFSW